MWLALNYLNSNIGPTKSVTFFNILSIFEFSDKVVFGELSKIRHLILRKEELNKELIDLKENVFGVDGIDSTERLDEIENRIKNGGKTFSNDLILLIKEMKFTEIFERKFISQYGYGNGGNSKIRDFNLKQYKLMELIKCK